jgi:hypothetical protein
MTKKQPVPQARRNPTRSRPIENRLREWQQTVKEYGIDAVQQTMERTDIKPGAVAIAKAFEQFGLDPQKPNHLQLLCAILADVVFGHRKRESGRKPGSLSRNSWNKARLLLLALAYEKVRDKQPGISDIQAAKRLSGHGQSDEVVRQRLPAARRYLALVKKYPALQEPQASSPALPRGAPLGLLKL